MPYKIKQYTYDVAKKLNVIIKPSTRAGKKIDVYDSNGDYLLSVGAIAYNDYPTYIETHGKKYADERRRLFLVRHGSNIMKRGSPAWYAAKLLW